MERKLFFLLIPLFFLVACSVPYKIQKQTDKFYPDRTIYNSTPIILKNSSPFDMAKMSVQFVNIVTKDSTFFGFVFDYTADNWAFLESMLLLMDGKTFELIPSSTPNRNTILGSMVRENIGFRFSSEIIELLKNSNSIDLRVKGQNRSFDFALTTDTKTKLKDFLNNKFSK